MTAAECDSQGGQFCGDDLDCWGDDDENGVDDSCEGALNPSCFVETSFDGNANGSEDIEASVVVQEIASPHSFVLRSVDVHLSADTSCRVTVSIQDGPGEMGLVLSDATMTIEGGDARWYTYDIADVNIGAGETYYVRASSTNSCGARWTRYRDSASNPNTSGTAVVDGQPQDDMDMLYGAKAKCLPRWKTMCQSKRQSFNQGSFPVFASTAPIGPDTVLQFSAELPAAIEVERIPFAATFDLLSADITISIAHAVDGYSQFTVEGVHWQFESVVFAGQLLGVSNLQLVGSGSGAIEWSTGNVLFRTTLSWSAADFEPISMLAHGSGKIISSTQIQILDDAASCQLVTEIIPTVSEWGLIVMTVLGLTAGTILYGRRRRPAAA
ncbi:MAG: hypothetical protein IH987_04450 [Planctomycetes bacterium]|nr:hypothetical protein [Planctomycetota bacterium]